MLLPWEWNTLGESMGAQEADRPMGRWRSSSAVAGSNEPRCAPLAQVGGAVGSSGACLSWPTSWDLRSRSSSSA